MVATVLTIINGCQKDELVSQLADEQLQEGFKPDVYAKNGFLVFQDSRKLNQTLNLLASMSEEERRNWEKRFFFTSQQTIFNDIVDAELRLDEPYETLSKEELLNAIPPAKHSENYYKYLNAGIIKEIIYSDGTESYDYSTRTPYLASILNEEGIFAVGDTMYQCTANAIKQWNKCDLNNKMKLMSSGENIDGIEINYKLKGTTVKYGQFAYDSGRDRRIQIGINFNSWAYYGSTIWRYEHWVEVISQKKNVWGTWKYNWTDMYLKGSWDYIVDFVSPSDPYIVIQRYTDNVGAYGYPNTYHIYASNLKSTYSIETGNIFPFGSVFDFWHYDVNGDLGKIDAFGLTHFDWEVTGHYNVKATVTQ